MKKFLLSLATAFSFVLFLGSCTNEEDINNNGYSVHQYLQTLQQLGPLTNTVLLIFQGTNVII